MMMMMDAAFTSKYVCENNGRLYLLNKYLNNTNSRRGDTFSWIALNSWIAFNSTSKRQKKK